MSGFKSEVQSGVKGAFGGVGKIVSGALVAAGAATGILTAGLVASAKSAINFESSMRNVNSIAQLGEKGFKNLGKSVTDMAAEVGQKPKVLADGLYDLVSSGFDAADAITVLKVSAKAATAGLTEASVASGAVAAALNAYHLEADQAGKVSDILFQTVNKGVLTFEELAQNMGDLVPAAAPLGITLEEVGAAMSTVTLQGVPAAEAATRVKNAMLQIATPSKALSGLLRENGYESGAAAIKSVGFSGVLDLMSKATGGNVDELAKLIPEMRGMLGVVGLTGKNTAVYVENLKAMEEATRGAGITQQVFNEQSKSLAVQWDKASAAIDVLKVQIGTALIPALSGAVSAFSGMLADIGKERTIRGKLNVVWEGIQEAGRAVQDKLSAAIAAIDWNAVWSGASGIGAGLAARFKTIDWTSVGTAIGDGIADAVKVGAGLGKKVGEVIMEAVHSIDWVAVGKAMGPGLATAVTVAFTTLMDPGFWVKNWDLALAVGFSVGGGRILKIFAPLGKILAGVLGKIWDDAILGVAGVVEKLSPKIGMALLNGLKALPGLLGTALGALGGVVTKAMGKLGGLARFTVRVLGIGAVIDALGGLARAAAQKVKEVIDWFRRLPGGIVAAFPSPGGLLVGIGISIISGLWSGLRSKWEEVKGWLSGLGGAIKGLKGPISQDVVLLEPEGRAIIGGLGSGMKTAWGPVDAWLRTLQTQIAGAIGSGGVEAALARQQAAWEAYAAALTPAEAALEKMNQSEERRSLQAAVRAAREELHKARSITNAQERATAIIAAEESLRTAELAITESRLTGVAAKERVSRDARVAAEIAGIERLRAQVEAKTNAMAASFEKYTGFIERAFGAKTQQMVAAMGAKFDTQIASIRAWGAAITDAERALQAFDASVPTGPTTSEAELAALDEAESERQQAFAVQQAQEALAKAQSIANAEERAAAILAAEEQLRQAQLTVTRDRLTEQAAVEREIRTASLAEQRTALAAAAAEARAVRDAQAAERITVLEAEKAAELTNLEERRRQEGEQLVLQLTQLQTQLAKRPGEFAKINKKIVALLKSHGIDMMDSGEELGEAFAKGLTKAGKAVEKAAKGLATIAANQLKLKSPAKEGPLSDLDKWFVSFAPTLLRGFDGGAISRAISRTVAAPALRPALPGAPVLRGPARAVAGRGFDSPEVLRLLRRIAEKLDRARPIDLDLNFAESPAVDPSMYANRVKLALEAKL